MPINTTTQLSPQAQAVLDASSDAPVGEGWNADRLAIAAVLRAAAAEVCLRWAELKHPADVLNTIADELETQ